MRINVLNLNDRVINVTNEFIAIERDNGEVDILPFVRDDGGMWVDTANILTIGYGNNTIQTETDNGVTITNF